MIKNYLKAGCDHKTISLSLAAPMGAHSLVFPTSKQSTKAVFWSVRNRVGLCLMYKEHCSMKSSHCSGFNTTDLSWGDWFLLPGSAEKGAFSAVSCCKILLVPRVHFWRLCCSCSRICFCCDWAMLFWCSHICIYVQSILPSCKTKRHKETNNADSWMIFNCSAKEKNTRIYKEIGSKGY